jgi:hypothetical protein
MDRFDIWIVSLPILAIYFVCACLCEIKKCLTLTYFTLYFSKQRGPEAEKANNVFYHLSYYDSEDLNKVEDKTLRAEIELHIADFGNCPSQLFFEPHRNKKAESLVTQSKVSATKTLNIFILDVEIRTT